MSSKHNIAISSVDHLVKMMKNIALDSKIIEDICCARTKTTAIIKNVIGSTHTENLYHLLKQTKFSMCIDESTDLSTTKLLSIVVRLACKNKVDHILFHKYFLLHLNKAKLILSY